MSPNISLELLERERHLKRLTWSILATKTLGPKPKQLVISLIFCLCLLIDSKSEADDNTRPKPPTKHQKIKTFTKEDINRSLMDDSSGDSSN